MDIYELTIISVLIAYSLGLVLYIRYMFSYEKIADLAISLIKEASSDKETMEEVYKMGGLFGAGLTKQVGGLIGGGAPARRGKLDIGSLAMEVVSGLFQQQQQNPQTVEPTIQNNGSDQATVIKRLQQR